MSLRVNIRPQILKETAPIFIIIVLALLILPIAGTQVGNNTSRWLTEASDMMKAKNIAIGIQGDLAVRRPLFPLIIAGGFKLWGKSVHSAALVIRIVFALEIILIYLIGRIFFGATAGLLSVGLVISSHGINSISKIVDTDIVQPFFILLFVLMYFLALRHESRGLALLAGISLGLAFLIKETAVFCLGIPIGIIIFAPKRKKWPYGKIFLWFLATLLVPVILWIIYMFSQTGSLGDVLKRLYTDWTYRIGQGSAPLTKWLHLFSTGLEKAGLGYYRVFLQKVTPIAILLPLSWIFVFIQGILKKKNSDLILGIFFVCALPIILQLGYEGDRIGQTTSVYMILYISLAVTICSSITWLFRYVADRVKKKHKEITNDANISRPFPLIRTAVIALIGFMLIGLQLFSKNLSTWKLWTEPGDALAIFVKKPFEVYGRFTSFQEDAAAWLKRNSKPETKIIADGYTNEALDFFDVAATKIPVIHPVREILISESPPAIQEKARPLFLFTYSNFDSGIDRARGLYAVFESDILAVLKAENPRYLVLSGRSLYLKTYFEKASWSRLVFNNQRVVVYEIRADQAGPISFQQVGVNEEFNEHAAWLEKNHPEEFPFFLKAIGSLNLTLDELKNSPLRLPKGQTY